MSLLSQKVCDLKTIKLVEPICQGSQVYKFLTGSDDHVVAGKTFLWTHVVSLEKKWISLECEFYDLLKWAVVASQTNHYHHYKEYRYCPRMRVDMQGGYGGYCIYSG